MENNKKGRGAMRVWRGLTTLMACLLAIAVCATPLVDTFRTDIDKFLGTQSSMIVTDGETSVDELYTFKSDYANTTELLDTIEDLGERMSEEGTVLLKNNGALPLTQDEMQKVSLLGFSSYYPVRGGDMGSSFIANTGTDADTVDLVQALTARGFAINTELQQLYEALKPVYTTEVQSWGGTITYSNITVPSIGGVFTSKEPSQEAMDAQDANWKGSLADMNVMIVTLARSGSENGTYLPGTAGVDPSQNLNQRDPLGLSDDERDLIQAAVDAKGENGKVIVLINSSSAMELQEVEDNEGVDAILQIGLPGGYGFYGIADILSGAANPSGHLSDTYAVTIADSPAAQNFGDFEWTNPDPSVTINSEIVQAEGIYVGYKYYETRYADSVLGQGNSGDWNYDDEVTYPFGYGLSYTTFDQTLDSVEVDLAARTVTANVTVTNTGDTPGKDAVELYVSLPYIQGGVEKSAIQLLDFCKTAELAPGASETYTLVADAQDMCSWDSSASNAAGTTGNWILDPGTYYFAVGNDAHDAVNQVLSAQGVAVEVAVPAEEEVAETEPEEASAEEAPVEEAPVEEAPVEEAPAEEAPAENEEPVEETAAEAEPAEASVEEAPAEGNPGDALAEEALEVTEPAEEAEPAEAPVEGAPAEEAAAEEAEPAEEAPAGEAPAEPAAAEGADAVSPRVQAWELAERDETSFAVSKAGVNVENQLADMDVNYWLPGTATYLSRSDWQGTFPVTYEGLTASQDMLDIMDNDIYVMSPDNGDPASVTFGADNGMVLAELKGITDINDPRWATLMDQITLEECMIRTGFGGTSTKAIDSIMSPEAIQNDGPNGLYSYPLGQYANKDASTGDPCAVDPNDPNLNYKFGTMGNATIIGQTWSKDLTKEFGEIAGNYSLWANQPLYWGCAVNIHRVPYNSRNHEYYSEDGVLSSGLGTQFVQAGLKYGCVIAAKHLAFNDTEINRSGVATFMTEQQARENELRSFQKIVEDGALAIMTAYNRVGVTQDNAHTGLMMNILRKEWGFQGLISEDFIQDANYTVLKEAVMNGITMSCNTGDNSIAAVSAKYGYWTVENVSQDAQLMAALKQAMTWQNYALAQSNAMDGLSPNSRRVDVKTWYDNALFGLKIGSGVLTLLCAVMYILSARKRKG